jgi:hypothetical protein
MLFGTSCQCKGYAHAYTRLDRASPKTASYVVAKATLISGETMHALFCNH